MSDHRPLNPSTQQQASHIKRPSSDQHPPLFTPAGPSNPPHNLSSLIHSVADRRMSFIPSAMPPPCKPTPTASKPATTTSATTEQPTVASSKRQRTNPATQPPPRTTTRPLPASRTAPPPSSRPAPRTSAASRTTAAPPRRVPVAPKPKPAPVNQTALLVSNVESLTENIVEYRTAQSGMQDTITALVSQLQAATQAGSDKENKLCHVSRENGVLATKVIMLEQEIQSIRISLTHRESDLSRVRSESAALQDKYNALQVAHSEQLSYNETHFQAELTQLQNQLLEANNDQNRLTTQVQVLTTQLSTANKEIALLNMNGSQQAAELSTIQSMYDQSQSELKSTQEALDLKTDRVLQVEIKLRAMETERRRLHNEIQELKGNIRVFCRIRPTLPSESSKSGPENSIDHIVLDQAENIVTIKSESVSSLRGTNVSQQVFNFDKVFPPTANQATVFEEISHLVQSALDGYNVSILAYGQTGSGKTFTMEGAGSPSTRDHVIGDPYADDDRGMIPRAVDQIFLTAQDLAQHGWTYRFEGQYVEIYNENVQDLLISSSSAASSSKSLDVVTDKSTGFPHVPDATSVKLKKPAHVHDMLRRAAKNRTVAATLMNDRSSRSHSVFILSISGENNVSNDTCESRLYLVDLAGSERVDKSGAVGDRRKEASAINTSLSHLGDVITHLIAKSDKSAGGKSAAAAQSHVPYRNSKLTRLLQASLGGNSKTLMFVNISPIFASCKETITSLRFGSQVNKCQIGTAKKNVNVG